MQTYIYEPLGTLLFYIYNHFNDIGWSIVIITLIVKILLLPLNIKASVDGERTQRNMRKLKPEMDKIKDKHKGDKMAEAVALQELYKKENFNPMSGLLSLLILIIQMPILFGLYHVVNVKLGDEINHLAFGLFDITYKYWWMGLLAGVTMYILGKLSVNSQTLDTSNEMQMAMANAMKIQMVYVFPVLIGVTSGLFFQSGIGIYFVVANLFGIAQLYITNHYKKKIA